jgi:uncharacterized protein
VRPLALTLLLAATLAAQDLAKLEPQGPVSDFARVIPNADKQIISNYLLELERATGAQVALVTVNSLDGTPIEDAANNLYRRWGIGNKSTNEGALFLFAIADRQSRLEVGYGLEPVLPDGAAGSLLRAMRPALRQAKYGEAFIEAARGLGDRISKSKGVTLNQALPAARSTEPASYYSRNTEVFLVILAFVIAGFLLLSFFNNLSGGPRGPRRRLPNGPLNSPWIYPGSFGGGGFGGSSGGSRGGSGWGGFGGGSSGGGGASSNW